MSIERLNLIRVHDHEGSRLVWQTRAEARAQRWQAVSQWCSETSLLGVAVVAAVWKWSTGKGSTAQRQTMSAVTEVPQHSHHAIRTRHFDARV